MARERKDRDIMSIKIKEADSKFIVQTLLWFFKDGTEPRTYRRPMIFPTRGALYNAAMGLDVVGDDLVQVMKVRFVPELIEGTTEKGDMLLRCLFSLPYVQEVIFPATGDFEVVVYPPYDLFNEVTAAVLASEIVTCVNIAAGKKLSEVDDIMAEELFEEKE